MPAELSEQERLIIAEGEQVKMMSMHAGWHRTREVMRQWEEDALLDLQECVSSDEKVRSNLTIRYQERIKFTRMVDGWIKSVIEKRKDVLREIAEQNGMTALEAFEAAENL